MYLKNKNQNSILSKKSLLILASLSVLLLLALPLGIVRASGPNNTGGTWNVYYWTASGCTGSAWTPTTKSGGGFADNAPNNNNLDPEIASGQTIYVQIVVSGGTSGTYTYELDGGNGPYASTITSFTVSGGSANVCIPITISDGMANAVAGPSCTVPEKVNGDILDHFILSGPNNTSGCNGGFVFAQPPSVTKDATGSYTTTYKWGIDKAVDQTEVDTTAGSSVTFTYTVTVTHDSGTVSSVMVTGTIHVFNPNSGSMTADVTDHLSDGTVCSVTGGSGATLGAGITDFSYSCGLSALPSGGLDNTATVSWADQTVSGGTLAAGSASFTFSGVSFTNTVVDGCVSVMDTIGGSLGTVCYTDPSPTTFTYTTTVTAPSGTCNTIDNTARFVTDTTETMGSASQSAKVCGGVDLVVGKTADAAFTRTFSWDISKSVDQTRINTVAGGTAVFTYTVAVTHDSGTDSAWTVTGVITVANPNDWEAIGASLADVLPGASCSVATGSLGDSASGFTLAASSSETFAYSCSYSSQPSYDVVLTNTATATVTSGITPDSQATGTADFSFTAPTTLVDDSVVVTDTLGGVLGTVSSSDASPTFFTYTNSVVAPSGTCTSVDNTATFTTDTTGSTGSASQSVTVCGGVDLTVSKTANPSFTRTYQWSISKSVDKTLVTQIGGTATFNYLVTVAETGFSDGGWQVTGMITLTNPNDWEAITANVADAVDNGGSCTVTGGANVVVPASGSVSVAYTCTYSSAPSSSSGTNTATASWDSAAFSTPDGSASGSASFAFTSPTTLVNNIVTVTDTFNSVTTTLGTCTATDSTPFASCSFSYSHTVSVPNDACATYNNSAVITQTGQSSSASVQVCGKVGALTMGYWQNKNGQGIITSGASTGGVCNVATWLRQYAPFKDLSATATCSQTATYVYNIIKAANAGGATANAMLKAQMLATALSVYFSDPSLGGNKIGAPAPVGGVTVVLTNLGGTDVSSAFGGASSMTVSQMLAYAASQSNSGGTIWYGNVKSIQVLGIFAFNYINNST